jgi:hypothetical protein
MKTPLNIQTFELHFSLECTRTTPPESYLSPSTESRGADASGVKPSKKCMEHDIRTCYDINFHVLVSFHERVNGCLEHLGVEEKGRNIPEQNSGLRKVWNASQVVNNKLLCFCGRHVVAVSDRLH